MSRLIFISYKSATGTKLIREEFYSKISYIIFKILVQDYSRVETTIFNIIEPHL